jgi:hypothetical protein
VFSLAGGERGDFAAPGVEKLERHVAEAPDAYHPTR